MTTSISRRNLIMGAAGIAGVGAALNACGSPGTSSGTPSASGAGGSASAEKVSSITFLTNADDIGSKKTVADFNATNPGFTVQLRQTDAATYGANFPRLATASDAPNIAGYFIDGGLYTDIAKAGSLVELTDFWQSSGMSANVPALIKDKYFGFTGDGKVYAVPVNTSRYGCMFYRPSVLRKAGATAPSGHAFASEAEFNACCDKLKAAGIDPISVGGKDGYPLSHVQDGLLSSTMAPELVGDPLKIDYLSPEWQAPIEKMVEWNRKGYWSRGFLGRSTDQGNTLLAQSKVGFSTGMNVWEILVETAGVPKEDLDWCLLPPIGKLQNKISVYAGGGFVLPAKATTGRAETLKFATWLASPEQALAAAKSAQVIPARTDVPGLEAALGPIGGSMYAFAKQDGRSQFGWDDPAPSDMIAYDRSNLQAVLAGTQTVKAFSQALEDLKKKHLAA